MHLLQFFRFFSKSKVPSAVFIFYKIQLCFSNGMNFQRGKQLHVETILRIGLHESWEHPKEASVSIQ